MSGPPFSRDERALADPAPEAGAAKAAYRPPLGMPLRAEPERKTAAVVSALLHVALIAALLMPLITPHLGEASQGAGGPGPAGGGGGGTGGTGGPRAPDQVQERLRFIQVPPDPIPTPSSLPPVEEKPEEKPPELDIRIEQAPLEQPVDMALAAGIGGGTGRDGTTGSGPGSGGGVGSGVGTGRGSAAGPGTGGGEGTVFPPQPIQIFLPPMPVPERVKPFTLVAKFDVDSTGRVLQVSFNATRDASYNRKLRAELGEVKFKPAVRWDGRPVRAIGQITYEF